MKKHVLFLAMMIFGASYTFGQTIMETLEGTPQTSTLASALQEAGLDELLNGEGPYTIFAPINSAFNALPANFLDALLADNDGLLTDLLANHVIDGTVLGDDLEVGQVYTSLYNESLEISLATNGDFRVNNARIVFSESIGTNGVIHLVNRVVTPASPSIYDVVSESADHNVLLSALEASGLDAALAGPGNFTLFAPTDAAFENLPAELLQLLLNFPESYLASVLSYHVVDDVAFAAELGDGQTLTTLLNGQEVTVTLSGDDVLINDALVTVADILTFNGVVHVIDAVLMPEIPQAETVYDLIASSVTHTNLTAALEAASLDEALTGEGPFTVFAPTDVAFEALPDNFVNALLTDPTGVLSDILLHHVVSGQLLEEDLEDGQTLETLFGGQVSIGSDELNLLVDNALVTISNLQTGNGVVHVIDAVLLPETTTVMDVVAGSPVHETLETALVLSELDQVLSAPGAFTLFAPTDQAFENLPDGLLDELIGDPDGMLSDVLLYHVLGNIVLAGDLADGQEYTTLSNGAMVTISIADGNVLINDALITVNNVVTSNGVVHVIDAVLVPEPQVLPTAMDIINGSDVHNVLAAALVAAGLDEVLSDPGTITVFAPTDAAFDALPDNLVNALLTDPSGVLTDILLYHVVGSVSFEADLEDGSVLTALNAQDLSISIEGNTVSVNGAQIIVNDIEASNGVVHVIDAVMLPETTTIYDAISESNIHTTLKSAIDLAELEGALSGPGPFTIFAPTDEAFDQFEDLDFYLDQPGAGGLLEELLLGHVVEGIFLSGDLTPDLNLITLGGTQSLFFGVDGDNITVAIILPVTIITTDIVTLNGVIHVIEGVLVDIVDSVEDAHGLESLHLYPNPTNELLNLSMDLSSAERLQITLHNVLGQVVYQKDMGTGQVGSSQTVMDVSSLNAGTYILRVAAGDQQVSRKVQIVR